MPPIPKRKINAVVTDRTNNVRKKIIQKYDERIPIIVYKDPKCTNLQEINKNKFLAPDDLTLGQFLVVIRKRIELTDAEALFVFVNEVVKSDFYFC